MLQAAVSSLTLPILDDDLALAAGRDPRGDGLQTLCFQPAAKFGQRGKVHLFQLVQQHKAAVGVQAAHNGGGYPQLARCRSCPASVSRGRSGSRPRPPGPVSGRSAPSSRAVRLRRASLIWSVSLLYWADISAASSSARAFVQVGAHLAVSVLHVADALLQCGGGFVLQLSHSLGGGFLGHHGGIIAGFQFPALGLQGFDALIQPLQFVRVAVLGVGHFGQVVTLALVLGVAQ